MKKSIFFFAAAAALTVLSSAAFAQQAMTSGIVTKVDETQGTIRIQYSQPGTVGGSSTDTSVGTRTGAYIITTGGSVPGCQEKWPSRPLGNGSGAQHAESVTDAALWLPCTPVCTEN